jgi:hypothetical protein
MVLEDKENRTPDVPKEEKSVHFMTILLELSNLKKKRDCILFRMNKQKENPQRQNALSRSLARNVQLCSDLKFLVYEYEMDQRTRMLKTFS